MEGTLSRITVEPGKRGGKPCVSGGRITVWDVLGWLAAGMSEGQILGEHPDPEKAEFPDGYRCVSDLGQRAILPLSLLLDENPSPRLTLRLASLLPAIRHVRDIGLKQADDRSIRQWARNSGRALVTT
jgi:uncharacterized protein (DUF433 family)